MIFASQIHNTKCITIHFLVNSADQITHLLGPSLYAIVSAYFEQYLYMIKLNCLITAIFHMGEHQTLDLKAAGAILTWGVMLRP